MKKLNVMLSIILLGIVMSACKKDTTTASNTYPYAARMTDSPGPYKAVYIDLQGVEITGSDGNAVMINVHPGIYNLLNFSNGTDTLIATGTLGIDNIQQIRLILGPNNSIVVDSVTYPLSTPSAEQSGLKLQVHQTLQAGVLYTVLLDFDANQSIVLEGNGTYKLKPVIRTIETALSGAIKGKISQIGVAAVITVTKDSFSYSSNVNATGDFLVAGIPPGTYSITITPAFPLKTFTQNNIIVTTGITTNIGTITLQ